MINKKVIIGVVIFFIITVIGFIQINIINTKALSSVGNGEDNYELVKEEFGEDFEEFIKDNAEVKIYTANENSDNTTIRIKNKEYILKMNNKITESFYNMGGFLYNGLEGIINKFNGEIKSNKDDSTQEVDKIIDDFLEKNN